MAQSEALGARRISTIASIVIWLNVIVGALALSSIISVFMNLGISPIISPILRSVIYVAENLTDFVVIMPLEGFFGFSGLDFSNNQSTLISLSLLVFLSCIRIILTFTDELLIFLFVLALQTLPTFVIDTFFSQSPMMMEDAITSVIASFGVGATIALLFEKRYRPYMLASLSSLLVAVIAFVSFNMALFA